MYEKLCAKCIHAFLPFEGLSRKPPTSLQSPSPGRGLSSARVPHHNQQCCESPTSSEGVQRKRGLFHGYRVSYHIVLFHFHTKPEPTNRPPPQEAIPLRLDSADRKIVYVTWPMGSGPLSPYPSAEKSYNLWDDDHVKMPFSPRAEVPGTARSSMVKR